MAALKSLEILGQIQVLVIDKLQVVSYKWLSRNFSVSSNQAKRLLQEFIDKHGDKVEVLYSLSGWLKNNSEKYCILLTAAQKLEESMKKFDGNCSVEVYSIQSCIPKDLAVLWNAEFVQAEELFNQPSTADNCLRNNRFGGIFNPFVERAVNGHSAAISTSQLKANVEIVHTKTSDIPKEILQPQQEKEQLVAKEVLKSTSTVGSVCKTDQTVGDYTTKSRPTKESTNPLQANRKGGPSEKTSSATGGSLATLWGRATVKPKPSSMVSDSTSNIPNAAYTSDAQICAEEEAAVVSSDDESYGISCKRSNGSGNRKRQFIINYSDEEDEDDNVVPLASPVPPNEKSFSDSLQTAKKLTMEKEIFSTKELKAETLVNKQDSSKERTYGLSPEKCSTAEVSLLKAKNDLQNELINQQGKDSASIASKRKKVVKTRTDERGREVMEVVWEEPICEKGAGKDSNTIEFENRPTATANKEQSTGSNILANAGIKGGAKKPGKVGGKDVKQGNIMSFFKKA